MLRFGFFVAILFFIQSSNAAERMVYAWQKYDPAQTSDNDTAKGYIFSIVGKDKKSIAEDGIYPSVSSDGRQIVYSEKQGTGYAIILKDIQTGTSEQWTSPAFNLMADLSGNGRYLAFSGPFGAEYSDREGKLTKSNQIAVIDLWKARNSTFVVSKTDPKRKIYSVQPDIIQSEGRAYFTELSSDGRFVVFHESYGFTTDNNKKAQTKRIVVYDRVNKTQTFVTNEKSYCFEPALSFDDRYIASVCRIKENEKDNDDIYMFDRMNLSSPPIRVTSDPGRDYAPTFRPNLSLVFSSDRGRSPEEFRLFEAVRAEDGSYDQRLLVDGAGVHYVPSYSGDIDMSQESDLKGLNHARSSFGVADMNGSILVLGGNQGRQHDHSEEAIVSSTEVFSGGKWNEVDSLKRPNATQGLEIFYAFNKIFAVGGLVPQTADHDTYSLAIADVYDPSSRTWQQPIKLWNPRSSFAAGQVGSKAYLLYGWKSEGNFQGEYIKTCEVLNLETMKVEAEFNLPAPYRRGFASTNWKNKIILVGGFAGMKFMNNVDIFDPALINKAGMIQHLPPLPFGAFSPTAAVVGDTLYVFGGVFPYGPSLHNDALYVSHIYKLDLAHPEKGWLHTGRYMREPKGFLRAIADEKNPSKIYLVGGNGSEIGREENLPIATMETWALH